MVTCGGGKEPDGNRLTEPGCKAHLRLSANWNVPAGRRRESFSQAVLASLRIRAPSHGLARSVAPSSAGAGKCEHSSSSLQSQAMRLPPAAQLFRAWPRQLRSENKEDLWNH